ncbi:hypothetical protein [Inquilinus sp.]|uniref:hypothetical protein n=1 Tax=Inquilinus sp. TaxID=1932117 RepID=UPI0031D5167A
MSDAPTIIRMLGRFLLNTLVLLAWMLAAALVYTLASCTSGDPVSWAILIVIAGGFFVWPVTLALLIGAFALAIRYPYTRSWWRTVLAITAVLAFLGAAAGLGDRQACSFGGF